MELQSTVIKVVILGDSDVGKTALVERCTKGTFPRCYRSPGLDYLTKEVNVGKITVKIQMWDTTGDAKYSDFWSKYCHDADCCVLIFSVTDPSSFFSLKKWKSLFLDKCKPKIPEKFPFVVIGNKIDIRPNKRKIAPEWISAGCIPGFSEDLNYFCSETSAKRDKNVDKCFNVIFERAHKYKHLVLSLDHDP